MLTPEECKITHCPAEVLHKQTKPIEKIDDNIRQIAEKMIDIMLENKGIGLAGPQAGVDLQIFVVALDGKRESARVYINPKVTPSGQLSGMEEGCLSVPGLHTRVRRYEKCRVQAADLDGNEIDEQAEGLYARCLQHENDHLQGITIADKLGSAGRIAHRRVLKKLKNKYEKSSKAGK
jgi:peptide deformylase